MKFLNILILLTVTLLFSNLCIGLFLPLLKGLKKNLIYGSYAPSYDYHGSHASFYGSYGRPSFENYYSGNRPYRKRGIQKRAGRTYSDIARVLNADPYAFVGRRPYPAQPFYPQG